MGTIITKNSATSGSVPASLIQGELAINVTDGKLFYGSGSGNDVKEFGVTASYALNALTASYAISASYEINYETSSSYADYAVSASHALTASFITASGVYGPYGSNSVISASFALTASSALNASDILVRVLNQSGNPISKGIVVRITGSNNASDIPRIVTASYENDNNSANTLGIANETIANGAEGFVMTEGILKGINTSAFVSGQLIYLGPTGSIIGTAPVAPLHSVRLGEVIREQLNNGSIYVRIDNGYELGELHDVRDTTTTSSYGDLLVKSGSIWINSKQLTGSYSLTGSLTISGSSTFTNIGTTNLTGSVNITGSTTQVGTNNLLGNTTLSGSIIISGSTTTPTVQIYGNVTHDGYIRFNPVSTNINTSISASYIYVSGSTNDLYFSQNGSGYNNVTRLRWIEGNLYTGLLHGGVITSQSSTVYQISSGSGIIVDLNSSLSDDPYPTIQYLNWPNLSASIAAFTASYQQAFVGIDSTNNIFAQGTPFVNGQFDTIINIGNVLFQNQTSINGFKTQPSTAYGLAQAQNIFNRAFGPLKLSGYILSPSGSSTGSLVVGSGTAYSPGANYTVNPNEPFYVVDPGTNISKIFRYYQSGSTWVYDTNGGVGYPTIDPTQYSLNGVLTPVPGTGANRQFTNQRCFWYPNSVTKAIVVYYGNATYTTELEAVANIPYESFIEAPNTAANAIYLGTITVRNDGNFTVPASFKIQPGGLFRQVGGSGGGGSVVTQTLSGLSDVNISGPTDGQALVYNNTALKWENKSFISASISGNAATSTTASFASTASFVQNAQTASYVLNAVSASFASTASFVQNAQTASYVLNAVSASFTSTASFVNPLTQSVLITGSTTITGPLTATQIGAGATPSGSIPLDVRAQGALSTDIAFRVRNSANSSDITSIQGDGVLNNIGNINVGINTGGAPRDISISGYQNNRLIFNSGYNTYGTNLISVTRRNSIGSFADNTMLFQHTAFSDGNNVPYRMHFVNPSLYYGSVAAYNYNAGFMWFKDSATVANLQMKLSPDNALSIYTSSASPIESVITGSGFQIWASGSAGNAYPHIRTQNGTLLWLGSESRLFNVTASAITASLITATQIGAGAAPSGSIPLDVRAQGALSTDIAFRVRDSSNARDVLQVNGTGIFFQSPSSARTEMRVTANNIQIGLDNHTTTISHASPNQVQYAQSAGSLALLHLVTRGGTDVETLTSGSTIFGSTIRAGTLTNVQNKMQFVCDTAKWGQAGTYSAGFQWFRGAQSGDGSFNTAIIPSITTSNRQMWLTPDNSLILFTAPTALAYTASIDGFQMYSSTGSIASNPRPHFRTGNGTTLWLGDESRLFNVTASRTIISSSQSTASGSSLTVYGSGSTQPVFTVQGSQGELFSITDSLSGSLFSVNDISGLPILEVFSDNTTLIGNYLDPMLITTAKVTQTNSGSFVVYSLPTASYDTAFFEYSIKSGSNARAGTIMAIQSGTSVNFTETTTTDFGNTTPVSFTVVVTGSNMALTGSSTTGSWTIKTIIRSI